MRQAIGGIALAAASALAACEGDPLALPPDEQFVVQAYLYAGRPVTDVRITSTLPLGSTDSVAPPINDAEVALFKNGTRYDLALTPGDSGYYHYPGDDLTVGVGDIFDLEATAGGVTATARTTVPPPAESVSLSLTELQVEGLWADEPIVVRWPNPERDPYFITHQNVEADPEPVFDFDVILRPELLVQEPTDADSAVIAVHTIRHYGRYEVNVYRVNAEYEQLYTSAEQDTRDLNEPATNIENGIGIFTAFTSRDAFFTLAQEP